MSIKKQCDCCEEEWEEEFFCSECSGVHTFDGETELVPNILWEGGPNDEYVMREIEPKYMDICFN